MDTYLSTHKDRMDTFLPTQPESNKSLLKRSLSLYAASFSHVILLALILAFITFIPRFLFDLYGRDFLLSTQFWSWARVWLTILNLVDFILIIAIFWRLHCVNRGYHEPFIQDVGKGVRKTIYVFIAAVVTNAVVYGVTMLTWLATKTLHEHSLLLADSRLSFVLTVLLVVAQTFILLYLTALFLFILPVIAIEDKGILGGIKRSISLVWNHWWRVFTLQIVPWFCFFITLILLRFILLTNMRLTFLERLPEPLWVTLMKMVLFGFFVPWVCALILVQLRDLELRKQITQKDEHAV